MQATPAYKDSQVNKPNKDNNGDRDQEDVQYVRTIRAGSFPIE